MLSDVEREKRNARMRAYYAANREKLKAKQRARYDAQRAKRSIIIRRYGITEDEHAAMLQGQGGNCAICRKPEERTHPRTGEVQALSIDHCHETGKVRGLLCNNCNRALGLFGDDEATLLAALAYLRQGVAA